jgi:hypothetical protein
MALNGSFFTTQRMLQEYVLKAYASDLSSGPGEFPTGSTRGSLLGGVPELASGLQSGP